MSSSSSISYSSSKKDTRRGFKQTHLQHNTSHYSLLHIAKKRENKLERFNKIAKEAAEQSFRTIVPQVHDIKKVKELDFSTFTIKLLCYEESAKRKEVSLFKNMIQNAKPSDKIAILVGPEGGIAPEEVEYLMSQGFVCVGLGPRILRTETVIYYVLSAMSYAWELK